MKSDTSVAVRSFTDLKSGDFFFHPLSGGSRPAIKIRWSENSFGVLDLEADLPDGSLGPTVTSPEAFEDMYVIFVPNAIIRPTPWPGLLIMGASEIPQPEDCLVLREDGMFIKTRVQTRTFLFSVEDGSLASHKDTSQSVWAEQWEVFIRDGEKTRTIASFGDAIV